jgi:hypothetical protein
MNLVLSSEGGCDCDCQDFNKEENKKFDNSGKPIDSKNRWAKASLNALLKPYKNNDNYNNTIGFQEPSRRPTGKKGTFSFRIRKPI